jgi:tyrosinase
MTGFFDRGLSRRRFIGSAATAVAAVSTPFARAGAQQKARYRRYNVASPDGQKMLQSYAVAVKNLMALDPRDPRNWFRNAFVHTIDCPHMNWWFFVWHRGYLGWFEQTLRDASGNPDFAIPYWDWTQSPRLPAGIFGNILDPTTPPWNPYIQDYQTFYNRMNPPLTAFWNGLSAAQVQQLKIRMMPTLPSLWDQVDPSKGAIFAATSYARYPTAANPDLDKSTKDAVSPTKVRDGLAPIEFLKFNSGKTPSHNTDPGTTTAGILEQFPHNKTHNYIGGYTYVPNNRNGFMSNNLSPCDPVFFLHHSNMDRLWDVWTRKQQKIGQPTLPPDADLPSYKREPFLFYVNSQGKPVTQNTAGDYIEIGQFDYDYEPGFGEEIVEQAHPPAVAAATAPAPVIAGQTQAGIGKVAVPAALLQQHAAGQLAQPLVVEVTLPRPATAASPREFDVLINAPPGTTAAPEDSPNYAGTVSFFGFMPGMAGDVKFIVPVPPDLPPSTGPLTVQAIPRTPPAPAGAKPLLARPGAPASAVKAVSVTTW